MKCITEQGWPYFLVGTASSMNLHSSGGGTEKCLSKRKFTQLIENDLRMTSTKFREKVIHA